MSETIEGARGELYRFAKGAKSWFFSYINDDKDIMQWTPPDGGRSGSDIVSHVSWVLSATSMKIAEDLNIKIETSLDDSGPYVEHLKAEFDTAYNMFEQLVKGMSDDDLKKKTTLPPPARIQESSIERILRIMAGYHVLHHAGQLAQTIRRAKKDLE